MKFIIYQILLSNPWTFTTTSILKIRKSSLKIPPPLEKKKKKKKQLDKEDPAPLNRLKSKQLNNKTKRLGLIKFHMLHILNKKIALVYLAKSADWTAQFEGARRELSSTPAISNENTHDNMPRSLLFWQERRFWKKSFNIPDSY